MTYCRAGGLIAVLDSSDYGPLVIRKAISIVDDGGLAGILSRLETRSTFKRG